MVPGPALARALSAELVLAHVIPRAAASTARAAQSAEEARKWAADELEDSAGKARAQGLRTRVALRSGVPHQEIAALVREENADLLVLATRGGGAVGRPVLDDVANQLLRLAPCPVIMVPDAAASEAPGRHPAAH
jgi:nucleotide-binding universal stress UspA family protein